MATVRSEMRLSEPFQCPLSDLDRIVPYFVRSGAIDDEAVRNGSIERGHIDGVELPPIVLYRSVNGWELHDGNHRLFVARQRGLTKIRACEWLNVRDFAERAARSGCLKNPEALFPDLELTSASRS